MNPAGSLILRLTEVGPRDILTSIVPARDVHRVPSICPLFSDRQPTARTSGSRTITRRVRARRMILLPVEIAGHVEEGRKEPVPCGQLRDYRMRPHQVQKKRAR